MIHLIRDGAPVGKARARVVKGHAYTPEKTATAEGEWQWLFLEKGYSMPSPEFTVFSKDVPLSVTLVAYMKDPMKKPDIDNIAKLVLDSLKGFAYPNDSQIVHLNAWKLPGEPRTEVWIQELPTESS